MSSELHEHAEPGAADLGELEGLAFACIEDCGFCCTFTPEVAKGELARLRQRFPALQVVRQSGVMRLAFQGGCGACTLLAQRRCTAYDDRPAHCRYFPFHVYFGRRTQVYVNRSCRGVAPAPGADLQAAFAQHVTAQAPPGALAEHAVLARNVHVEFERSARAADAWGDVDAAVGQALGHSWFDAEPGPEPWARALAPFAASNVVARPFHLDAGLRWLTFRRAGLRLEVLEMQEDGALVAEGTEVRPAPAAPPPAARPGLAEALARLAARDVMAGQVFDLVDAARYRLSVARAARNRVAQMAADLAVRVQVLQALGVAEAGLADEAARFYDSAFLDAPTIGGWL